MPLIGLGIYLGMRYLPRIDPGRANYARFRGAYSALRTGILLVMGIIHATVLLWSVGRP